MADPEKMKSIELPEGWRGDWELDRKLGSGAYSSVYRAVRKDRPSIDAAIKIISIPSDESETATLREEGLDDSQTQSYYDDVARQFTSEIDVLNRFKGTSHIVTIEDYKIVRKTDGIGNNIFIRMELLTPLDSVIRQRTLSEQEAIRIGIDICDALELCESYHILHRDIKPANIFINDRMPEHTFYKLGDFGIARSLQNLTSGLSAKGTPGYMAPEIFLGKPYDNRADLYSLGITLYRLTNNNRLPLIPQGDLSAKAREEALSRRLGGETLPPPCKASEGLSQIILKACAFSPEMRYASASEMKADLEALVRGETPVHAASMPEDEATTDLKPEMAKQIPPQLLGKQEQPEPKKQPKWVLTAVIAGALMLIGVILAVVLSGGKGAPEPSPAVVIVTGAPTANVTAVPTDAPAPEPTAEPTPEPTEESSPEPTQAPADETASGLIYTVYNGKKKVSDYERPEKEKIHMPLGDDYSRIRMGILTFRNDAFRRNAAAGTVKDAGSLQVVWRTETGSIRGANATHYGTGWASQPLIVQWAVQVRESSNISDSKKEKKALKEVIAAGLDGKIRFLDLDDGTETRGSINLGYPMNSTPSVHSSGYPYMNAGQSIRKLKNKTGKIGLRQYNMYTQKELKLIDGLDGTAKRPYNSTGSFETSALIDRTSDTVITAGTNGMLYLINLNSEFDWNAGIYTSSPSTVVMTSRAKGEKDAETAVESSPAMYDKYVFYADMGGILRCVDTDTLTPVWFADTGDSVMAAVALDEQAAGEPALYTANMLNNRKTGNAQIRRYDALTGKEVWCTEIGVRKDAKNKTDSGCKASPVIGQNLLDELVWFTVTGLSDEGRSTLDVPAETKAALVALDKETGAVRWAQALSDRSESSPVAVYDEDGNGWIIQCAADGTILVLDGLTGRETASLSVDGEIAGSPAVYNDIMVFGTTGKGTSWIYGVRIGGDEEEETATPEPTAAPTPEPTAVPSGEKRTYDITVWVSDAIVNLTKQQIQKFNATNQYGIKFNATVRPVSESESATNMISDMNAGADIYCFAQDQFARLIQAGALSRLSPETAADVSAVNDASAVRAARSGDAMYAYPLTADNGYFMYYDRSVIPEEDIDSLEKLIADCEAARKYFAFEVETSAWYMASFFFGAGCESEWFMDANAEFIGIHDTFNSPEGLIAVKGMKKLVDSPWHLSSSRGSEFSGGAAIVVSGTWDYETVRSILGSNTGAADLPSFEVDGKEYHLGSFSGCKLMGVKPQDDPERDSALHLLAEYLTGEKCQTERFDAYSWGPSNLNAQASDAVQANPALAALMAQNAHAVPQGQIHGSWWDIAKCIGEDVRNASNEAGLRLALQNYEDKISALFSLSDDVRYGWTIIGMYNEADGFFYTDYSDGKNTWSDDLTLFRQGSVWVTGQAYYMPAGTEFKVRRGLSWDYCFPDENFRVETSGYYEVMFDETTGEITLIAR